MTVADMTPGEQWDVLRGLLDGGSLVAQWGPMYRRGREPGGSWLMLGPHLIFPAALTIEIEQSGFGLIPPGADALPPIRRVNISSDFGLYRIEVESTGAPWVTVHGTAMRAWITKIEAGSP
jgi:hypothetical protein